MTMFIKLENGQPTGHAVTEENLRLLFPDTTFPPYFTPDMVAPFGFGMYEFTQIPTPPQYGNIVEVTPVKRDNGIYYQTFDVVPMTDEEKAATDAAKVTEVKNLIIETLKQSDWTQLPDNQLSPESLSDWTAYRQSLRDLPKSSGFPWDTVFPTPPADTRI